MADGTICIECGHMFKPSWDDVCEGCSGMVCPTDQVMHKIRMHNANNKEKIKA